MANESYDSGHVVIPVVHPSGDVHNIAVPADTSLPDFHEALTDYYHPLPDDTNQPTAAGAVENSEAFRQRAQQAWDKAMNGMKPNVESGFDVGKTGTVGALQTHEAPPGSQPKDTMQVGQDSLGALHTHPSNFSSRPSPADIAAAKGTRKTMWVTSKDGLYAVDPGGNVSQVYNKADWMKKKKN